MTHPTDPNSGDPIYDSPTGWVKRHIDEYVETGGAKGQSWKGTDTLLLTTRGRKTGRLRRTALIYKREGENYVVVASKGGAPDHPAWYLNLTDNAEVSIQVGADLFEGKARTAKGEERERLWSQMSQVWPAYKDYQTKTDREIPIVVIEVG
jgi:deazaflavin-dependent oxidoreductase (nitroreductase family)